MSLAQPHSPSSEVPIQLSAAAIAEIQRLNTSQGHSTPPRMRLNLANGGCEQFLYDLKFDIEINASDQLFRCQGLEFYVQTDLLAKIRGLQIDYSEDLMGGGFRYQNPNATKHCSCGNSFSVNDF